MPEMNTSLEDSLRFQKHLVFGLLERIERRYETTYKAAYKKAYKRGYEIAFNRGFLIGELNVYKKVYESGNISYEEYHKEASVLQEKLKALENSED